MSTSRSVRTSTRTVNGVTVKTTTETVTGPDGKKVVTTTEEEIREDGATGNADKMSDKFRDDFSLRDRLDRDKMDKFGFGNDMGDRGRGTPDKDDKPSSPKTDKKSLEKFQKEAEKAHNDYRAKHDVKKLKMTKELCKYAQDWAEHLAKIGTLQHSPCVLNGDKLGENCAMKSSSRGADYTGEDVTSYWYSEIKDYNSYGREPQGSQSGHFTQVIWKSSEEMGIGKAFDSKGGVVVVGSYKPPGNFRGRYADNVFPPK